jgi:hypothetical protein
MPPFTLRMPAPQEIDGLYGCHIILGSCIEFSSNYL